MSDPLTDARLAEIAPRHQKGGWEFDPSCGTCMDKEGENSLPWPCDAGDLLAEVRRLRQGLARLERHTDEKDDWEHCAVCGEYLDERVAALRPVGHAPGCALRTLIAGGGATDV